LSPPNIGGDDVGREFSVERCRRRRFVGHLRSPCRTDKIPFQEKSRWRNRTSIMDYAAPLTSFWFPV
jgi:hypothetical protein